MADPKLLRSFNVEGPQQVQETTDPQFGGTQLKNNPGLVEKLLKLFYDPVNPIGISPMPMMLANPVYHGTNQVFDKFLTSKLARDTLYGVGHYFTDNPAIASGYAENKLTWVPKTIATDLEYPEAHLKALTNKAAGLVKQANGKYSVTQFIAEPTYPNVHKVYLDINNPFDVDKMRLTQDQLNQLNIKSPIGSLDYLKSKFPGIEEHFPEMLNELGYDSLTHEGNKMSRGVTPHRVYIVNDESKIIPAFSDEVAKRFANATRIIK